MAKWHERMAAGTRGRILALLRRSDQTIPELAESLGISGNAVRVHVAALERDGLLHAATSRSTGGKPAQVYALTDAGVELFPRAYAIFLAEMLGLVLERDRATARRLLREVGRRVGSRQPARQGTVAEGVQAAAAALRLLGGNVEVEATGTGFRLRGHGCPLRAVTAQQPAACVMAEAFVAAVTGQPTTEKCEKGDRPRCVFEVRS